MKNIKTFILSIFFTIITVAIWVCEYDSDKKDIQKENHKLEINRINQINKDVAYASFLKDNKPLNSNSSSSLDLRTNKIPLSGNLEQMKYFYKAIRNSRNSKIRIAHYGDSIILGDVITEYLRENMQKQFGGNGVGLLSLGSNDNKMRRSVLHSYSDDWNVVSIFTRNPDQLPLGMSSRVSVPGSKSWGKYEKTNFIHSLGPFQVARLFYSNANRGATVSYNYNGSEKTTITLKGGALLQEEIINCSPAASSIDFEFLSCQNTYFYGVSLENGNGVYVDNFPITGNSGVSLVDIPMDLMKQFDSMLNYKLIILNFGVNVGAPKRGTYTLYENKMIKVIEHLKKAFPETSILIISVADRTVKSGSKFMTDRDIPILLKSQEKIAENGNVAFWNLFEAMGGKDSMVEWVDTAPPMALKDYRHFTHEGGKIVADLLFNALMTDFKTQ